jgi:hypothetical protein
LIPSRVPLEGRADCTFETVQTSASEAALADAARAAADAPQEGRMLKYIKRRDIECNK